MYQRTINSPVSCYGIGVHSGKKTQLTLKPAPENTGIVFVRTDVTSVDRHIKAVYDAVYDTSLSTSIKNIANVSVSTIEHLMAALWGCGIDNLFVELDGPEVPIMDGSSKPFVFMIECVGSLEQRAKRKKLVLLKEVVVSDGTGAEIIAKPSDHQSIDLTIDFASVAIGKQHVNFSSGVSFKDEIADSRTFGFLKDLDFLLSKGLAKGASLDNTIGIDNDIILNHDGLRHPDEFVRHKLLDLIGDLYNAGGNFIAEIKGIKTSHNLNNQLLRKIFSDPFSYQWK